MQNTENLNATGAGIDLKNTRPLLSEDLNHIFIQGLILRKISRFITGTEEDQIIYVPVLYDAITKKIHKESIPKEIRAEYL